MIAAGRSIRTFRNYSFFNLNPGTTSSVPFAAHPRVLLAQVISKTVGAYITLKTVAVKLAAVLQSRCFKLDYGNTSSLLAVMLQTKLATSPPTWLSQASPETVWRIGLFAYTYTVPHIPAKTNPTNQNI